MIVVSAGLANMAKSTRPAKRNLHKGKKSKYGTNMVEFCLENRKQYISKNHLKLYKIG